LNALFKKLTAIILSAVITLSPITAQRADASVFGASEIDQAGWILLEALELIATYYKGDIDFERLLSYALSGMTEALDDEFSYFLPTEESERFVENLAPSRLLFGIIFGMDSANNVVIQQVLYGSSAQEEGISSGDIILSVNGVSVSGLSLTEVTALLVRAPQSQAATIEFLRNNENLSVEIYRRELPNPSVFVYEIEELLEGVEPIPNTRVVYISFIGESTADELRFIIADLRESGVKNIILDLRNNSGGYMDIGLAICQMLMGQGPVLVLRDGAGNATAFHSNLPYDPFEEIIVLTDRGTASAAEIIAAALRDRGATIIGEQTFGKASLQHFFDLEIGHLRLTTHEVFSPNGTRIHDVGITPDIEVTIPNLVVYTADGEADILGIKKILEFLGFYDAELGLAISKFRESTDLYPGVHIDIYFIAVLNAHFLELVRNNDFALKAAYEYIKLRPD